MNEPLFFCRHHTKNKLFRMAILFLYKKSDLVLFEKKVKLYAPQYLSYVLVFFKSLPTITLQIEQKKNIYIKKIK